MTLKSDLKVTLGAKPSTVVHPLSNLSKLGELLSESSPGFHRGNSGQIEQNPLPTNIDKKHSHYAQEFSYLISYQMCYVM